MKFRCFFETDDKATRDQMLQDYIKMISFDGQRVIAPGYIEVLRKRFETSSIEELIKGIEEDKKYAAVEKANWETQKKVNAEQEKRNKLNLRTNREEYKRTDDTFERVVCANGDPEYDKRGMPAYDSGISSYDNKLKGLPCRVPSETWQHSFGFPGCNTGVEVPCRVPSETWQHGKNMRRPNMRRPSMQRLCLAVSLAKHGSTGSTNTSLTLIPRCLAVSLAKHGSTVIFLAPMKTRSCARKIKHLQPTQSPVARRQCHLS